MKQREQKLSLAGLKKLNPLNRHIPVRLIAKEAPVSLPDLGLIIADIPINVFLLGEQRVYQSKNLEYALQAGLLIDPEAKKIDEVEQVAKARPTIKKFKN